MKIRYPITKNGKRPNTKRGDYIPRLRILLITRNLEPGDKLTLREKDLSRKFEVEQEIDKRSHLNHGILRTIKILSHRAERSLANCPVAMNGYDYRTILGLDKTRFVKSLGRDKGYFGTLKP